MKILLYYKNETRIVFKVIVDLAIQRFLKYAYYIAKEDLAFQKLANLLRL